MTEIGAPVVGWHPPPAPGPAVLSGRYVELARLSVADHAAGLWDAFAGHDAVWDYMYRGPFDSAGEFSGFIRDCVGLDDPWFYAIRSRDSGRWAGMASWLRIAPEAGSIEVGNIALAPELQRTRAATEAMHLLADWAFSAGYRRYEWKCNALNRPSRRAAERLGFSFEGVFRQAAVVKGRNRDTAWFAITDGDWAGGLSDAFRTWLAPENFDKDGAQRQALAGLTAPFLVARDPFLSAG